MFFLGRRHGDLFSQGEIESACPRQTARNAPLKAHHRIPGWWLCPLSRGLFDADDGPSNEGGQFSLRNKNRLASLIERKPFLVVGSKRVGANVHRFFGLG